jgi:hypothetical protein
MCEKGIIIGTAFAALGAFGAVLAAGCADDGGGAQGLYGTWERQKIYQPGSASDPEIDTWTITFREDGTFTSTHVHEEVAGMAPQIDSTARNGKYSVGEGGRISFSGGWADDLTEVETLDDLAENYSVFTQETMYLLGGAGDVLFLGPDFNYDSVYIAGDSYNLLFSNGSNGYAREANLVLTGGDGTVLEQRLESFSYTLVDATVCSVAYSISNVGVPGSPAEATGTASDCTYTWTQGRVVDGLDGADTTVDTIQFVYTIDGFNMDEDFAFLDDALLSFNDGFESKVLVDNAYRKVSN